MNRSQLLRTGAFLAIGLVGLFALDAASRAHPPRDWDGILLERMDTVRAQADRIEVLVVGNSHAEAVDPEALGREAIVFPFPWGDVAETSHQVRTLRRMLPELRLVIVTASWFTFHWSNAEADEALLLDSRRTFHAVAPGWRPVEGDLASLVRGKSYWVTRRDHWYRFLSGIMGGGADDTTDDGTHLDVVQPDSVLVAHAEERVPETLERKRTMMERNPDLPRENHVRLSRLVEELQAQGIRVVLLTTPVHWRFSELYREEAQTRAEMETLARDLAADRGVQWLDFSEHPMGGEARWFRDSDHLNADGRRRLTRMLLDSLEGW